MIYIDDLVSNKNISEIKYAIGHDGINIIHNVIDSRERYVILTEEYFESLLHIVREFEDLSGYTVPNPLKGIFHDG